MEEMREVAEIRGMDGMKHYNAMENETNKNFNRPNLSNNSSHLHQPGSYDQNLTNETFLKKAAQCMEELQSFNPPKDISLNDNLEYCLGLGNLNPETYIPRHMAKNEKKFGDNNCAMFVKPDYDPRMSIAKTSKLYELFKKQVMCDVVLCTADGKVCTYSYKLVLVIKNL